MGLLDLLAQLALLVPEDHLLDLSVLSVLSVLYFPLNRLVQSGLLVLLHLEE